MDTGKAHHHCVVIDAEGRKLLSRKVANDEPELEKLIAGVTGLGEEVTWAADMAGGGAALLIGLLAAAGQRLLYLPGHVLAHAASEYRGEGKTDPLTELPEEVPKVSGRTGILVATVADHDHRRRCAA